MRVQVLGEGIGQLQLPDLFSSVLNHKDFMKYLDSSTLRTRMAPVITERGLSSLTSGGSVLL